MTALEIYPLASSSKGNAYIVKCGDELLVIDNGLSYREFKKRFEVALGKKLEKGARFAGVLITHSHSDHVQGLRTFLKNHPETTVFANEMTASGTAAQEKLPEDVFCCFENGQSFEIGPFMVNPFSIPHDTADPVGYLVKAGGATYFHGTDIGTPLDSIGVKLAEAEVATLESNHDLIMLKQSQRAISLKQRIWGPRGHLSNDQSADLVKRFASPKLKRLMLAHLSEECNTPRFAEETMREALEAIGRKDVVLEVLRP